MASCVMRRVSIGLGIAVVAMLVYAPAHAVDIVNRDKVPRDIVVNDSDGNSIERTLKPQEAVANICAACVILTGDTSVETMGDMIAVIEAGKIKLAPSSRR